MAWATGRQPNMLRILVACGIALATAAHSSGWRVELDFIGVVDGEAHRATPLTIGAEAGATDAFERGIDLLAPPPPPGWRYAEAYVHRPDSSPFYRRLNTDIRALPFVDGSSVRWDVVVTNPTTAPWSMSWDVSTIPEEWQTVRLEGEAGEIDMRATATASVPPVGAYTYTVIVAHDPIPEQTQTPADDTTEVEPLALVEAPVAVAEFALVSDLNRREQAPEQAQVADVTGQEPLAIDAVAPAGPPNVAADAPGPAVVPIEEAPAADPPASTEGPSAELAAEEAGPDEPARTDLPPEPVTPARPVVVETTPEDVTGDGVVGIDDVLYVARRVGVGADAGPADVDGDGAVTIRDLTRVAAAMEAPSAAPSRRPFADDVARLANGAISVEEFVRGITSPLPTSGARLLPNYPNPFNPETWIPFEIAEPGTVTLTVFDSRGAIVRRLDLGYRESGVYRTPSRAAYWDGRTDSGEAAASGSYVVALNAGGEAHRRRIILVK